MATSISHLLFSTFKPQFLSEKGTEKGKCRSTEIEKCRNQKIESRNRKMESLKIENTVFKTLHLRNQEQIVIILKTFICFIHIIVHIELEF